MSIVIAIVALCVLIVVHEAGHMIVARYFSMRVEKFSIFFGPPLVRWRGKHTTYQLATIPLGGYVQIAGMNPHEPTEPNDPGSYTNKSVGARFATIAAGPITNYLLATLLIWVLTFVWGLPERQITTSIEDIQAGHPAAQAGLQTGDVVVAVNTRPVNQGAELIELINQHQGQPLTLRIRRSGTELDRVVVPERVGNSYRMGVTLGNQLTFERVSPWAALWEGIKYPLTQSWKILQGLQRMITGEVSATQVGGAIEVVKQLKVSIEHGIAAALEALALLNVVLGLFNLFPIPALDGGRLVFLFYNFVTGRPVNPKFEAVVHTIGFVLLMGLFALLIYRDVVRNIGG